MSCAIFKGFFVAVWGFLLVFYYSFFILKLEGEEERTT